MQAFKIIRAGNQAILEVEGLRSLLFRVVLTNYLIFLCLTIVLNGLFFFKFLNPMINSIFGVGEGFLASLGDIVLWSVQLTFTAIITLISLRFSFEFLYLWNQSLVKKIILNFRKIEYKSPTLKYFWKEINFFLVETIKSTIFAIIMLFIGLIPLIGLPTIFLLESHILGRQILTIYLENITNADEVDELKKIWRFVPIKIGWFTAILSFVPVIGWIFLPLTITYQVIGFAYTIEKSRIA